MSEKQLIDQQESRNFFVYMSNRGIQDTFPLLTDDPFSIQHRAYHEISMGYTVLIIYERKAIVQEESWTTNSNLHNFKPEYYQNFLFVQQYANSEHVSYSAFEPNKEYSTLNEAVAAGKELVKKKQQLYPGQIFTVVCAAYLVRHNWH